MQSQLSILQVTMLMLYKEQCECKPATNDPGQELSPACLSLSPEDADVSNDTETEDTVNTSEKVNVQQGSHHFHRARMLCKMAEVILWFGLHEYQYCNVRNISPGKKQVKAELD